MNDSTDRPASFGHERSFQRLVSPAAVGTPQNRFVVRWHPRHTRGRQPEHLAPLERAVYLLREAFSHSHAETAEILDITEAAGWQYLHRARSRITSARRRGGDVDPAFARRIVEEFLAAASSRPPRTPRRAAHRRRDRDFRLRCRRPGRDAAAVRHPAAHRRHRPGRLQAHRRETATRRRHATVHYAVVNGAPAMLFVLGDRVVGAVTFDITGGQIVTLRVIPAPAPPRPPHRSLAAIRTGGTAHHPKVTPGRPTPRPGHGRLGGRARGRHGSAARRDAANRLPTRGSASDRPGLICPDCSLSVRRGRHATGHRLNAGPGGGSSRGRARRCRGQPVASVWRERVRASAPRTVPSSPTSMAT